MRILYLITELDRGGAEQALFQVARGVRAAGHDVCVAALFHGAGAVGRDLREAGVTVRDLGAQGVHLGTRWRFRELCAEYQPDLIHSWLFRANAFSRWFALRSIPLVCSARVREHRFANIILERFAPRTYTYYLCVSESVAEFAKTRLRIPQKRLEVIGNGVDVTRFSSARKRVLERVARRVAGGGGATPTLTGLTVARVVEEKGLDILLDGLIDLPPELDWHWHFVGATPRKAYAERLKKRLAAAGCAGRATWHGVLEPDRLLELYGQADLFALPSRYEGQPNVVLEAMACGLPTLVARVDGVDELVARNPRALRIVQPNQASAWRGAIDELCRSPEKATVLSAQGVQLARETSWQIAVEKHLRVYEAAVGNAP